MKQCFRKTRKNKKNREKQNNCFYLYFVFLFVFLKTSIRLYKLFLHGYLGNKWYIVFDEYIEETQL